MRKINNNNFILSPEIKFGSMALTEVSLNIVITKTVNAENIEDSDEYLNIKETAIHVKINKILNPYDKANKTPR